MKLREIILNSLIKNKGIISVNIVGSFTETNNLDTVGDIDVVVICKKITKKLIKKLNSKIKKIKIKSTKKELIINNSFGPLKMTKLNSLPIHLMIYDVKSHIEHVISSPFTCYDWKRTKYHKGIPLKKFMRKQFTIERFFSARELERVYE